MNVNRTVVSIGLLIISGICTTVASWLEIKDTIEDCKDTYREEMKELLDSENRSEAS